MSGRKNILLKVCGMREAENIRQVASLHPDYMGFIFYRSSPRFVGDDFAMPDHFPSEIKRVGVFVNEVTAEIGHLAQKHTLDYVQLHGDESVEQCSELRALGIKVIKVFSIGNEFDFNHIMMYEDCVDFFLFDTKGRDFGGNGIVFDWTMLQNYSQNVPFFLSGGISPGTIVGVDVLKGMNLHAVDVNSGVECSPGIKDVELVRKLKGYSSDS